MNETAETYPMHSSEEGVEKERFKLGLNRMVKEDLKCHLGRKNVKMVGLQR